MLRSFPLPKHLLDPLVLKKYFKLKDAEISDSLQNRMEMGFLLHVYTHAHVHTKIWQHKPSFRNQIQRCYSIAKMIHHPAEFLQQKGIQEDTRPCSVLQRKICKGSDPHGTVKSQIWAVLVLTFPGRTVRTRWSSEVSPNSSSSPQGYHKAKTTYQCLVASNCANNYEEFPFYCCRMGYKNTIILPNQAPSYGENLAEFRQKPFNHIQPLQPIHLFPTDRGTAKDAQTGVLCLDVARRC